MRRVLVFGKGVGVFISSSAFEGRVFGLIGVGLWRFDGVKLVVLEG